MTYQVGDCIPLSEWRVLPRVSGIYQVRNLVNSKLYVGLSANLQVRVRDHARALGNPTKLLYKAIRKYGLENFSVRVYLLEKFEHLPELERMLIAECNCLVPRGYNMTLGGEGTLGFRAPQESIDRAALARTGLKHTEATKELMRVARYANNHQKGVKLSEERKLEIAEHTRRIHTGLKRSEETKSNISKSKIGKGLGGVVSDEVRAKISATHKKMDKPWLGVHTRGENNPMYGKPSHNRREGFTVGKRGYSS